MFASQIVFEWIYRSERAERRRIRHAHLCVEVLLTGGCLHRLLRAVRTLLTSHGSPMLTLDACDPEVCVITPRGWSQQIGSASCRNLGASMCGGNRYRASTANFNTSTPSYTPICTGSQK